MISRLQRWLFGIPRILGRCPRLLMNTAPSALSRFVDSIEIVRFRVNHSPARLTKTRLQQLLAPCFRQALDDQIVRMIDHLPDLLPRNNAVQFNCVPMLLVHVVTRAYLRVTVA